MVWLGLSLTKKIKAFRSDQLENMPQRSSSLICRSNKVENMPQRSFSLIYLITELNHEQHVLIIVFSFISEPVSVLPLNRNVLVNLEFRKNVLELRVRENIYIYKERVEYIQKY